MATDTNWRRRSAHVCHGGGGGRIGDPGLESARTRGRARSQRSKLSARGVKQGILPLHNLFFFFRAPSDGDWLRAQMMRQERIPSPLLQYSGWEGGKKRGGSVGFRILSPPRSPFLRADSIPAARDSTASFTGTTLHLYAPPFWVIEARQTGPLPHEVGNEATLAVVIARGRLRAALMRSNSDPLRPCRYTVLASSSSSSGNRHPPNPKYTQPAAPAVVETTPQKMGNCPTEEQARQDRDGVMSSCSSVLSKQTDGNKQLSGYEWKTTNF